MTCGAAGCSVGTRAFSPGPGTGGCSATCSAAGCSVGSVAAAPAVGHLASPRGGCSVSSVAAAGSVGHMVSPRWSSAMPAGSPPSPSGAWLLQQPCPSWGAACQLAGSQPCLSPQVPACPIHLSANAGPALGSTSPQPQSPRPFVPRLNLPQNLQRLQQPLQQQPQLQQPQQLHQQSQQQLQLAQRPRQRSASPPPSPPVPAPPQGLGSARGAALGEPVQVSFAAAARLAAAASAAAAVQPPPLGQQGAVRLTSSAFACPSPRTSPRRLASSTPLAVAVRQRSSSVALQGAYPAAAAAAAAAGVVPRVAASPMRLRS